MVTRIILFKIDLKKEKPELDLALLWVHIYNSYISSQFEINPLLWKTPSAYLWGVTNGDLLSSHMQFLYVTTIRDHFLGGNWIPLPPLVGLTNGNQNHSV